jgi:hypothetical protein
MKTVACAEGSSEQRQLGLGADRVEARGVEDDEALAQQRMRVVDDRVAPRRHLDPALVVARRVVLGMRVVPEAERARRASVTHSVRVTSSSACASWSGSSICSSRRRQARCWMRSSPSERPSSRVSIGSRASDGGLLAVPAELDRAHRRPPGRRGQDAAAGVGEEDRVDQLRLAARELGDERDDELLVAEALAQRGDLVAGGALRQVVLAEEAGQRVDAQGQGGAPLAEGIEAGREGMGHRGCAEGARHRSAGVPGGHPPKRLLTGAADVSHGRRPAWRPAPPAGLQRRWQPGQKKVARPPWTIRRTVPPQRTHDWPARP